MKADAPVQVVIVRLLVEVPVREESFPVQTVRIRFVREERLIALVPEKTYQSVSRQVYVMRMFTLVPRQEEVLLTTGQAALAAVFLVRLLIGETLTVR